MERRNRFQLVPFRRVSALVLNVPVMYNNVVQPVYPRECHPMAVQTTYSSARANLAALLRQVGDDREIVIIKRRNAEDVAMITASELSNLLETAHLLRSPKNAERLLVALNRALTKNKKLKAQTLEKLRQEMGVGSEE
jgi:antitoxin YefM